MVTAGVTERLPLAATVPMPWLMLTEVGDWVVVQVSVLLLPGATAAGLAEKVICGTVITVTVVELVVVPPGPVAVMVYVVVADGVTTRVPLKATVPMPWLMLTVVAFVDDQVSVVFWPRLIDAGDTLMLTVGGWFTVTVTLAVLEP